MRPASRSSSVDRRDGHMGDPGALRQLPDGRQALPGGQFPRAIPNSIRPRSCVPSGTGRRAVERSCEAREDALIGRLFRVTITDAFISVRCCVEVWARRC